MNPIFIHINLKFLKGKQLKLLLFSLFIIAIGLNLVLSINSTTQAQIRGFGSACIDNYQSCSSLGTSWINLFKDIGRFSIKGENLSEAVLREAFAPAFTSNPAQINGICVNTDKTNLSLIPFFNLIGRDGDLQSTVIVNLENRVNIRTCPKTDLSGVAYNTSNSKMSADFNQARGAWSTWGCCPAGYQFVTKGGNLENPTSVNESGLCARIPSGARPNGSNYPHYLKNNGLFGAGFFFLADINGDPLYGGVNVYDAGADINNDFITKLEDPNVQGVSLKYSGSGLSTNFVDPTLISIVPFLGSGKSCANLNGCSLVPGTTPGLAAGSTFTTSGGNTVGVIDPDRFLTTPNLTCNQCYVPGEAMFIETPGGGATPQLVSCVSNGATSKTPLVNNNIADTLAILNADSQLNEDFFEQCRAQGGVPTAIGCVDTTPVGIITGLIRISLGVMGGVALIQLIVVGIYFQQGNEAKIKEGREQLTATITGIVVLVFSVLILRIIGVNVLDILPSGTI